MSVKAAGSLTIGLDIGIASVGWAVLAPDRIVALGVRAFDKAETAKEGDSLNLVRRMARLMRRRLRRRAWRLTKLARLLKREGLIADANLFKSQKPFLKSLWALRVEGLDRQLSTEEWARVIYHLCKHRGFHWISRAEEKQAEADSKGEGGKVKQGLAGTAKLMKEKGYRNAAEMVLKEFPNAQRNKQGDYSKALSRDLLSKELKLLFKRQRELGNPHAGAALEAAILGNGDRKSGLFWAQKPALAGPDLLKMLGRCTFEKTGGPDGKGEYRAPKASYTAERHVWLTRLNNLRIVMDGSTRPLNEQERHVALPLPYTYDSDFTYKRLRSALVKTGYLSDSFRFAGLAYPSEKQKAEDKTKDPETSTLVKLPAWQELRKTLKDAGLENEWQRISVAALEGQPELLDQIAWVLSVFKEDDEVAAELHKLPLPSVDKMVDALLDIRFDKFHALSLKALRRIVPHMEAGLRYDEACEKAGYHHSQLFKVGEGTHKYLPPFYSGRDKNGRMVFSEGMDIPRNPVVLRALNQARKVVNALIREYGSPHEVHIEMARDLSRPLKERKDIEKEQAEYRDRNDKDRELFIEQFGRKPKDNEFEKFRLYREQQGKSIYPSMSEKQGVCAYSFEPIDIERLLEPGYVEIDHALPYQRSFDDSKNNRVLALARENRNKSAMTPYEYLGGEENSDRWRQFEIFVNSNKIYRQAKRNRLLKKDFGEKEAASFRERNLNDTRYICRFFKNYVEQYLQLHPDSNSKRCAVLNGSLTSLLRARWGLPTSKQKRAESDRHHAMDAVVVAACGHHVVKRLSTLVGAEGWVHKQNPETNVMEYVNVETGEILSTQEFVRKDEVYKLFPRPWPHFRDELLARLKIDDPVLLRAEMERLGTYPPEALEALRPLFVSRAVNRRGGGEIHKAKIFSLKDGNTNKAFEKVPLSSLTLAKLEKLVGKDDPRNQALYEILRDRLKNSGDDPKKAFGPHQPKLLKPSKEGKKPPEIRAVRVEVTQNSGLLIRGGIADLGEMICVDIFQQKMGGFVVIPRYQAVAAKMRSSVTAPVESTFYFSLTKNDLVEIEIGAETIRGYFVMYESDGRMTLRAHDQPQPDKKFFRKSVAGAKNIKKFHVDILGGPYLAPPEKRRGLA